MRTGVSLGVLGCPGVIRPTLILMKAVNKLEGDFRDLIALDQPMLLFFSSESDKIVALTFPQNTAFQYTFQYAQVSTDEV